MPCEKKIFIWFHVGPFYHARICDERLRNDNKQCWNVLILIMKWNFILRIKRNACVCLYNQILTRTMDKWMENELSYRIPSHIKWIWAFSRWIGWIVKKIYSFNFIMLKTYLFGLIALVDHCVFEESECSVGKRQAFIYTAHVTTVELLETFI